MGTKSPSIRDFSALFHKLQRCRRKRYPEIKRTPTCPFHSRHWHGPDITLYLTEPGTQYGSKPSSRQDCELQGKVRRALFIEAFKEISNISPIGCRGWCFFVVHISQHMTGCVTYERIDSKARQSRVFDNHPRAKERLICSLVFLVPDRRKSIVNMSLVEF